MIKADQDPSPEYPQQQDQSNVPYAGFTVFVNIAIFLLLIAGTLGCMSLGIASLIDDKPQSPLYGNGYAGVSGMPYWWACFLPAAPFLYLGVSFFKERKQPYTKKAGYWCGILPPWIHTRPRGLLLVSPSQLLSVHQEILYGRTIVWRTSLFRLKSPPGSSASESSAIRTTPQRFGLSDCALNLR